MITCILKGSGKDLDNKIQRGLLLNLFFVRKSTLLGCFFTGAQCSPSDGDVTKNSGEESFRLKKEEGRYKTVY